MITIGVTGIMGSGKTLVSGMFKRFGAEVINADKIVRELLRPGSVVSAKISKAFGEDVFDGSGCVDRKKLSDKVFFNSGRVEVLNGIIHPEVINIIEKKLVSARARGARAAVIDAPLLFEAGLDKKVDFTVFVRASNENALERISGGGVLTGEDFSARMKFQMPAEEKEKNADFTIDNNGTVEETELQARVIWERITGGKRNEYS